MLVLLKQQVSSHRTTSAHPKKLSYNSAPSPNSPSKLPFFMGPWWQSKQCTRWGFQHQFVRAAGQSVCASVNILQIVHTQYDIFALRNVIILMRVIRLSPQDLLFVCSQVSYKEPHLLTLKPTVCFAFDLVSIIPSRCRT